MRALSLDRVVQELTDYMSQWMLLEKMENDILLYPAVGKLLGSYPASFHNESGEGEDDGPLEDE